MAAVAITAASRCYDWLVDLFNWDVDSDSEEDAPSLTPTTCPDDNPAKRPANKREETAVENPTKRMSAGRLDRERSAEFMRTLTTAELEVAMLLEKRRLMRLEANIRSLSAASTWRHRHTTRESCLGHPRVPSSSPSRRQSTRDVSCGAVGDSSHASPCSAERKSRETISQHRKRWLAFRNADVINRLTLDTSSSSRTIAKRREADSAGKTCRDSTGEGNGKATANEHRSKEQSSAVDRHKRTPVGRRPKKPSIVALRTDLRRPEFDGQKPPLDAVRTESRRPEIGGQKQRLDAVSTDNFNPEVDGQNSQLDAVRTECLRPEVDGQKPPIAAVSTDSLRPEVDGQKPPLDAVSTDSLRPEVVGLDERLGQERVHAQTNNTTPQADVVTGRSDVSEIGRPREGAHVIGLGQTVTVIAHRSVRLA